MAVVTISRLLGTGGDTISTKVADGLGYELIDKGLIIKVAKASGVSVDRTLDFDEKSYSRSIDFLMSLITPNIGKFATGEKHLDPKTFIEYARKIILDLKDKGNVIIVGRGAQFILKDYEECFHVRIIADEKFRIERVKNFYGVTGAEAVDMIKKSDTIKKNFIERYFDSDMDNPKAYHMILNSSRLGIDQSAEILINAVERYSEIHEYIPGIRDRRKGPRRSGIDRRKRDRRAGQMIWTIKDKGKSLLQGRPIRAFTGQDRRKSERRSGERRKPPQE